MFRTIFIFICVSVTLRVVFCVEARTNLDFYTKMCYVLRLQKFCLPFGLGSLAFPYQYPLPILPVSPVIPNTIGLNPGISISGAGFPPQAGGAGFPPRGGGEGGFPPRGAGEGGFPSRGGGEGGFPPQAGAQAGSAPFPMIVPTQQGFTIPTMVTTPFNRGTFAPNFPAQQSQAQLPQQSQQLIPNLQICPPTIIICPPNAVSSPIIPSIDPRQGRILNIFMLFVMI